MSLNAEDLQILKLPDLKKLCKEKSLPSTGSKNDLITRLLDYEKQVLEAQCNEVVDEQDLLDDTNSDADVSEPPPVASPVAMPHSSSEDSKPVDTTPSATQAPSDNENATQSSVTITTQSEEQAPSQVVEDISFNDSQVSANAGSKPLSQLSLEERKRLREERFKLGGGGGIDKLKKRAERFGEVTNKALMKNQVEEKLNQRSQRFGTQTQSANDPLSKLQLSEDERKRLRAARFNASAPVAEEDDKDKKLKRAARFGLSDFSTDNEVAKKVKRAERFGLMSQ